MSATPAGPPPRVFVPVAAVGTVIPDERLLDVAGRPLSLRESGRTTIVSFAYTRCPDERMCALVTAKFARLQQMLSGTPIRLVEVTLDPVHDTPAVLARYATAFGARKGRWDFATGASSDVTALSERLGIAIEPANRETPREIRHTEAVAIISDDGVVRDLIDGNTWSVDAVAAQARADARLTANPLARLALRLFEGASAACGGRGGGVPLIGAIAIFAALTLVFGIFALRIFAVSFFDWS